MQTLHVLQQFYTLFNNFLTLIAFILLCFEHGLFSYAHLIPALLYVSYHICCTKNIYLAVIHVLFKFSSEIRFSLHCHKVFFYLLYTCALCGIPLQESFHHILHIDFLNSHDDSVYVPANRLLYLQLSDTYGIYKLSSQHDLLSWAHLIPALLYISSHTVHNYELFHPVLSFCSFSSGISFGNFFMVGKSLVYICTH